MYKFDKDDFDFDKVGIRDYGASWVANLLDAEVNIGDFVSDSIVSGVSLIANPDFPVESSTDIEAVMNFPFRWRTAAGSPPFSTWP